ncbi:MAG: hypothetical protein H6974_06695 [Gammaproteobacteria bacterium]|nr:hypothetical protein [Gammaproteobacteria bacterium]MCP5196459.1 hypothetical protein [Gammaproteobacteria bacterium]
MTLRIEAQPARLDLAERCWMFPILLAVLSVGLLYGQLASLYAPPLAISPAPQDQATEDLDPEPLLSPRRREDAELFDRALTAGLLRLTEKGQITVAPADLLLRRIYQRDRPDLLVPRGDEPDWLNSPWNDEIRRLHQALHFSASGRYVRRQIEAFNTQQRPGLTHIQWRNGYLIWSDRS